MKKLLLGLTCLIATIAHVSAQQDPLYSQYLINPFVLNPAYAGLNNNFNANVSYRAQWTGFEGSPTTGNLNANMSLVDNKVGVGLLVINDKLGSATNNEVQAAFSYKLQLEDKVLSFGMQAGVLNFKNNYSSLVLLDQGDPAFATNQNTSKMNIGAGLILKSEKFFVGLSVPRLLSTKVTTPNGNFDLYNQHFYLLGSYVFYMTDRIRLKPSVLLKGVKGSPLSVDLNFNLNLDQKYTAGVFTRNLNTYGLLLQALMSEKFNLGYTFEVPTGNSVGTQFTTHELLLGIKMSVLNFHERSYSNF